MGTQTEIVRLIRQKKADYVLTLKSNHPTLHSQVQKWFDAARVKNFEGITVSHGSLILETCSGWAIDSNRTKMYALG